MKLFIRSDESGNITTWGEGFEGGTEVEPADVPADWETFRTAKYVFIDGSLTVRAGWTDPEPES